MVLVRSCRMGSRLAIASGLLAGILVGGLAVGGAVALLPPAPAPVVPTPSPLVIPTASPSPAVAPSITPSAAASPSAPAAASPSASASASTSQIFGIGQAAPSLRVAKLGGGTISLADLRGKPVWVNFMATWCPECRDELPLLAGFQARYATTGLTVVLVDVKEPGVDVAGYLKSLGVSLPVGLDDTGTAAADWKVLALPMHFWLTGDGVVAAGAVGSVGADQMAVNLATILPGVNVTP